jgi:hypothetical protein
VAEIKKLDVGNLNPIYEREPNKPDVHQQVQGGNVYKDGEGGKGCRHKQLEGGEPSPLSGTRGVSEVREATALPKPMAALCRQWY